MPVDVRFHTKVLQYEPGQVVRGLTRGPILDGLIGKGYAEVLSETPAAPPRPAEQLAAESAPDAADDEHEQGAKPRRPRKTDGR